MTTVDRYQGQQNDFILLSLVRTRAVGHLRYDTLLVCFCSQLMCNCFSLRVEPSSQKDNHHHRHHNRFTALFLGAGARTEFLNFMVQGKINRRRHTDHPMDATPSGLSSAHLHHHPSKITVSNNWSAVSGWISLSSGRQRQSTEVINGDCCGSEPLLHSLTH